MENDKKQQYTQAVWQMTQALQSTKTIREALSAALRVCGRVIGAEEGSFWYHNKRDNRIYPIATLGDGTTLAGMSLAYGEGIAGDVIKTGQPTFVRDCAHDPRFASRFDAESGFRTRSMLCMPLVSRSRVIGCMQLINKLDGSLFDGDDERLCEDLAYLAGIAMEGASLTLNVRPQTKSVITARDLRKEYGLGESRVRALRGVSLDVYERELLVIYGESGSGKSTLLHVLGGLEAPTAGQLTAFGRDLTGDDPRARELYRREDAGMVFQEDALVPSLTARENVQLTARLCKDPLDADAALLAAGLLDKQNAYPDEMTAAQRQRVAFARALVKQPKVLLLDDPTASLPYEQGRDVCMLLEKLLLAGQTMVMITGNPELAKMANRVLKLQRGTIADSAANGDPLPAEELEW